MDRDMHTSIQNEGIDARHQNRYEPYRHSGSRGRTRVWARQWLVVGETLDGAWFYLHPKRHYNKTGRGKYGAKYMHAMCERGDWEKNVLETLNIYIPKDDEQIRVWSDGSVCDVTSLLKRAISMTESVPDV